MFFAVFGIIVLTEVLLIDEKGRNQGLSIRKGFSDGSKYGERSEYDDQGDDYFLYHNKLDTHLAAFLRRDPVQKSADKLNGNIPGNSEAKLPPLGENQTAKDGEWQTVTGTRSKFYVYSAYYDKRRGRSIRIIGATKTRGPDRVWCRLWYPVNSANKTQFASFSIPAQFKMIRENWNLKYSACFVICPLRRNMTAPASVSIVSRLRHPPSNHLIVRNPEKDPSLVNRTRGADTLAVCVKPLHYSYDKALQMLEFLEMYRMLGMEHITMYNHTIGPTVDCILDHYKEKGIVTILPWKLNMKSQKEIRTEGLFAALNDCLYRGMYKYTYVAMVDLDEFIIPRQNDTILDLIHWISKRIRLKNPGSYSFQNAFFYLQWEDDPLTKTSQDLDSKLITMRKTKRKSKLHPHKQRSKYICRPEYVIEAGNHFVWEFLPGHGTINVPADSAILHHYRICEFGGNDCIKTANIRDRIAFRYRDRLLYNVKEMWNLLKESCKLPNVPE
ncbi:hypothetical protein RUM43_004324 [Polyplax serrata]|uniref:Glycosyltransferase family 92 protein n=1 Tax=Polyplax serrata TaxID=468196 RepID=A0AAN8XPP5_POLSC